MPQHTNERSLSLFSYFEKKNKKKNYFSGSEGFARWIEREKAIRD
jgi:hypothetical protein